jgi:hypothetical protein
MFTVIIAIGKRKGDLPKQSPVQKKQQAVPSETALAGEYYYCRP